MSSWAGSDRAARLPSDWQKIRKRVLARDRGVCQLRLDGCTVRATEVDHIVAGDNHRLVNLEAACHWCHSRKSSTEGNTAKSVKYAANHRPPERHPGLA